MNVLWTSYILVGIYSLILSIFIREKKIRKKIFLILVSIQLILLFAMRDINVGVDLIRYERVYTSIEYGDLSSILKNTEYYTSILFYIIIYVCTRIGISYHAFLGLVGGVCVIPYSYIINKYSEHEYMSILVYLSMGIYSFQFSGLKQSIAMIFVLLAFNATVERSRNKFIIYIILAMMFHLTAIVCIPFYILYNLEYKKWMLLPVSCLLIIVYVFKNNIGQLATHIFSGGEYVGRYESSGSIGTVSILLLLLLVYIIIFANNDIANNKKEISYYFKLIIIAICIQVMSAYAYSFTRLNFYYIQFLPIIISNIIDLPVHSIFINKRLMKIISIISCIVLLCIATYMYNLNIIKGINTVDYHFYKEKVIIYK